MNKVLFSLIAKSIYKDSYMMVWSILLPLALFIGLGIYHQSESYRENLLVGSILVSLVMGTINTSGFWLMMQRKRGVFKLIKLSSLSITKFVFYSVLARLLVFEIITVMLILIGNLLFALKIGIISALLLISLTLVGVLCFNSIGYIIASRARNEGMMNMSSTLFSMPMIFLSTAFYSLERAPRWITIISKFNPVEYAALIGRAAIVEEVATQALIILVSIAILCSVVAVKTFRYE